MSQTKVNIKPTDTLKLSSISSFTIANFNVSLFLGAFINVILHDNNNNFVQTVNIHLTKEEYDGWLDDDNYILNLIATKLGFEIMNHTAVAVTPTTTVTTDSNTSQVTTQVTTQETTQNTTQETKEETKQ